jgi:hypothetical protein
MPSGAILLDVYVASLSRVFMVPVDECPVYALERWLESYISPRRVA